MKNFVFLFFFALIGSFSFAQSSCSCGDQGAGHGCSTNCGAGFMASCQGYGGNCSCSCLEVKTPQPFGKIEIPSFNGEIKTCGLINAEAIERLSGINFRDLSTFNAQSSKIYNDFVKKIKKAREIATIQI